MKRYAIILSAEEYEHYTPTKFTHADNELIFNTLTEKCDYGKQHVLAIKLTSSDSLSPSEILKEIRETVKNSNSGDSILFYFAGHGHYYEGKTYLILPNTVPSAYETTALLLDDLSDELRVLERSCFRLFDACHSGIDVRDGDKNPNSQEFIRSINHEASGWVTLAACKEDQYSIADPKIGHGLFTHYICDEIVSMEKNASIYPELLKINIADKVLKHSKSLGYTQTPTLNASISGNISLAIRRENIAPREIEKKEEDEKENLDKRIAKLRGVENILTDEKLETVLNLILEQIVTDLKRLDSFNFNISIGEKTSADDIPEDMHSYVVKFSRNISINPRHYLERHETYDEPYSPLNALSLYQRKKQVSYSISQPDSMPPSASIIELKGDSRCIPDIKILIYLIPLQITGCMLFSVYNSGWDKDINDLNFIKNYYQMLKPDDSNERIKEIGPFVAKGIIEKAASIVKDRVNLLERELNE